jgi:hypothetical protein
MVAELEEMVAGKRWSTEEFCSPHRHQYPVAFKIIAIRIASRRRLESFLVHPAPDKWTICGTNSQIELPPQKSNLLETSFHPIFQKFLVFLFLYRVPCLTLTKSTIIYLWSLAFRSASVTTI